MSTTRLGRGVAGVICEVCGRLADSVATEERPGPVIFGSAAQKMDRRRLRSRVYSHGADRCWTAWEPVGAAAS